jgi:hypothetical protein
MGVVIEICAKYPGGPTRITVTGIIQCGYSADMIAEQSRCVLVLTAATAVAVIIHKHKRYSSVQYTQTVWVQ